MNRRSIKTAKHNAGRRGIAAVEFAMMAPILTLLTMGMIEIGRVAIVQQTLVNVSREAARFAVSVDTSTSDVVSFVSAELSSQGISGASVTTIPASLASAPEGSPVTVVVEIAASSISWIPNPVFTISSTLHAETVMRRETR